MCFRVNSKYYSITVKGVTLNMRVILLFSSVEFSLCSSEYCCCSLSLTLLLYVHIGNEEACVKSVCLPFSDYQQLKKIT